MNLMLNKLGVKGKATIRPCAKLFGLSNKKVQYKYNKK